VRGEIWSEKRLCRRARLRAAIIRPLAVLSAGRRSGVSERSRARAHAPMSGPTAYRPIWATLGQPLDNPRRAQVRMLRHGKGVSMPKKRRAAGQLPIKLHKASDKAGDGADHHSSPTRHTPHGDVFEYSSLVRRRRLRAPRRVGSWHKAHGKAMKQGKDSKVETRISASSLIP
jgi:hypothetical protein